MREFLRSFLMPWKQAEPLNRVTGCISLIVLILSIILFFTDAVTDLLFVATAIFVPLVVTSMIRTHRDMRGDSKTMETLRLAIAVRQGTINMDDLPGPVQEDIRAERARYHLDEDK